MQITNVRAHHLRIPYDAGVAKFRHGTSGLSELDMVVVEVSTDQGVTGWGDAFSYVCPRTTCTAIDEMIAPQVRGREVPEADKIPAFMQEIQRNLHLFGRYGITMFAISGLDIALWDIAARVKGVPLHQLIGGARRLKIPAYASLLRIGNEQSIAGECEAARRAGYGASDRRRARRQDHSAFALFRSGLSCDVATAVDKGRRAHRSLLHEAGRVPLGWPHRRRCQWLGRRAIRARARLRAGQGRAGAIPRVVTKSGGYLPCFVGAASFAGEASAFFFKSSVICFCDVWRSATVFCSATAAAFNASIWRLAASSFN